MPSSLQSFDSAIADANAVTLTYSSGLQVSGVLARTLVDAVGELAYIGMAGPTFLAVNNEQIVGHGVDHHPEGFGSPVGLTTALKNCLSSYTVDELADAGIVCGQRLSLLFESGILVHGLLKKIESAADKNLIFSFDDCRVTAADDEVLFDPAWGCYDMALGESCTLAIS